MKYLTKILLIIIVGILYLSFAPKAEASIRMYGQVYYQSPDGTRIGMNNIPVLYYRVREGSGAEFSRITADASWNGSGWELQGGVIVRGETPDQYCIDDPDAIIPINNPNGWYVFKSSNDGFCTGAASPINSSQDTVLCSNESDLFHPQMPGGYSFPAGVPSGSGHFEPVEHNGFPGGTNNNSVFQWDYQWVPDSVPAKTCSLSVDQQNVVEGNPVTISYSGSGNNPSENVRLYTETQDPNNPGYTQEDLCTSTNGGSCSNSVSVTKSPGTYYAHCDLPSSNGKCSGNPFCSYNGGPMDCSGWTSCSGSDRTSFTVSAKNPPVLTTFNSYNATANSVPGKIYGISGRKSNAGGSDYNNALHASQSTYRPANSADVILVGFAFISHDINAWATLSNLVHGSGYIARYGDIPYGFVVIYANQTTDYTYTDWNENTQSQHFDAGNYYVYVDGVWSVVVDPAIQNSPNGGFQFRNFTGGNAANPQPTADITFTTNLMKDRHWDQYGYMMSRDSQAGYVEQVSVKWACPNGVGAGSTNDTYTYGASCN